MPADSLDDKILYTPEEAARRLNSHARTLERWRTEGNGPRYVKIGRRVHYRREALDDWIIKQERGNTSEKSSTARRSITPSPDGQASAV